MRTLRIPVTIAALLALLVLAAACGSSSDTAAPSTQAANGSSSDASSSTNGGYGGYGGAASTTPATDSGQPASATVGVATAGDDGQILVGPDGRTLYLFTQDDGTTTACGADPCKSSWPALAASSPTAGTGVDQGSLATADGQVANQVTYHGHLLYYFAGDSAPGDVNGAGIPGWYPVTPAGTAVDDS